MILFLVAIIIFIINLPFGFWRENQKRFSLKWFLAIHIPVPIIIAIRIYSDVGFEWYTYPLFITAFFLGQLSGALLKRRYC